MDLPSLQKEFRGMGALGETDWSNEDSAKEDDRTNEVAHQRAKDRRHRI